MLLHLLHKPVAFFILPLFAIVNTAIALGTDLFSGLGDTNGLGIMAGLVIGKPLGIVLFSFLGVILGISTLPSDLKWRNITGAGFLGGIGFTMSIFITLLAYTNDDLVNNSKIAVIVASILAGTIGYTILKLTLKQEVKE